MPKGRRFYMDPEYLLDQLEQEWEQDTIIASDLPSLRPKFKNNTKLFQARRSQARQKNIHKDKVRDKKENPLQKEN